MLSGSLSGAMGLRILLTLISLVGVSGLSWLVFLGFIARLLSTIAALNRILLLDSQLTLEEGIVLASLILESAYDLFLPGGFS